MPPDPHLQQELLDRRFKAARADAEALQHQVADILDRITDGLFLLDREGRYLYMNELARRLMRERQHSPDDLLGKVIWEALPDLAGTEMEREFRRAVLEHTPARFEFYDAHMDRWLNIRAFPSREGLAVYFQDVTPQKLAERSRRESEEQFRQLAENIREVFWLYDLKRQRMVYISPAFEEMWGRPPLSLDGNPRSLLQTIHPEDRERVRGAFDRQGRGETTQEEYRILRPDGSLRWIHDRAFPVLDEQGQAYRVAGIAEDVTDRKAAATDLRRVTSGAQCILWHCLVEEDERGWLLWEPTFFEEESVRKKFPLDIRPGETYAQAWYQSRLPGDRERADLEAHTALRGGQNYYHQEFRHRLADGRIVWFLQTVTIERLEGERWSLVGVCVDITDRKQAEEELDYVLHHARCILWSADVERRESPDGPYVQWLSLRFEDEAAQSVLPLDVLPGEDYATAWWRARDPEQDRRMSMTSANAFLSGDDHYRQEIRCTDKFGDECWLNEDVSIQVVGEGRWRAVGVITDITEQKRMQAALVERERSLREQFLITDTLAKTAAEALFMTDGRGRVTFMNPAAEATFGWGREELIGRSFHDAVHPPRADGTPYLMRECPLCRVMFSGEQVEKQEARFLRRDGSVFPVLCSAAPILAEGRVMGAVLVVHDLTERKMLEDALRHRAEELLEADRLKNEFLSMLAHELRNPLGAISNSLYILNQIGPQDARPVRIRESLGRQLQALTRLVDDLLDVNRISQNKIELRMEPVDLETVVHDAVETIKPQIEEHRHELEVTLPPDPVRLEADAARIVQVLGNLLHNAAKYTPVNGKIHLFVEREGPEDAPWLAFHVRDNGMGIAEELRPYLFDLFSQGQRSLARSEGGLGIGLTVVKRLVEMHGGAVEARSEGVGKGAEFIVRLPGLPPTAEAIPPPPAEVEEGKEVSGLRVLLVEDIPDAAEMLAEVLELLGHEVRYALDGPSALEIMGEFRPHAVLLDIGLPGMDGYAIARAIRERGEPVFLAAMTGYGLSEYRDRSDAAGFDAYLVKPLDIDQLRGLLARVGG